MVSGRAVSRATRGHFIVDTSLHAILLSKIYSWELFSDEHCDDKNIGIEVEQQEDGRRGVDHNGNTDCDPKISDYCPTELRNLSEVYQKLENNIISKQEVCQNESLKEVSNKINAMKEKLHNHRTARLWFQYMEMIAILQQFIRAERTGDWL